MEKYTNLYCVQTFFPDLQLCERLKKQIDKKKTREKDYLQFLSWEYLVYSMGKTCVWA